MPFLGTYHIYLHQKHIIRKVVKNKIISGLKKSDLFHFRFTPEEMEAKINWKHSKEFEYDGKMFDVVYSEKHQDSVLFWCWPDKQETRLNKIHERLFLEALGVDPITKSNSKKIINFKRTLIIGEVFTWACVYNYRVISFIRILRNYRFYLSEPLSPPPK